MFRFGFEILTDNERKDTLTYFPDGSLSLLFILAALTFRYKDDQTMMDLGKLAYSKAKTINDQLDSEIEEYAQQYFQHPDITKEFLSTYLFTWNWKTQFFFECAIADY